MCWPMIPISRRPRWRSGVAPRSNWTNCCAARTTAPSPVRGPIKPAAWYARTKSRDGTIGAREFALMQPYAYFITTARGFIHDEAALLEALRNRSIAGAGLDVWAKEPPPADHPLLEFNNVLASPHTAGVTREA